jgi:hypothetical protein
VSPYVHWTDIPLKKGPGRMQTTGGRAKLLVLYNLGDFVW